MAETVTRQRLFDGLAIGTSTVCLLHCLAVPLMIVLLPALGAYLTFPEEFHLWMLLVVAVTSFAGIGLGYLEHRRLTPACLALTALAILVIAEPLLHEAGLEVWAAVPGSILLAIAHLLNLKYVRPGRPVAA